MDWQELAEDHRASVEEFAAAARAVPQSSWDTRPAPDKWSPGQIAEHLRLTYEVLLREAHGGKGIRIRLPWWRRTLLRATVMRRLLRRGEFPQGAPAVKEIRPGEGPFGREATLTDFERLASEFAAELTAHREKRFTHAFFGRMASPAGLRFLAIHNRHHKAQLPL